MLRALSSRDFSSAGHVTRTLTAAIHRWADLNGWRCELEVPLACLKGADAIRPGRRGVVDIVITGRGSMDDIVVELDRGNKLWSARKLTVAGQHGMIAIWVRWHGRDTHRVLLPPWVSVIRLDIEYPRPRRRDEQLGLLE